MSRVGTGVGERRAGEIEALTLALIREHAEASALRPEPRLLVNKSQVGSLQRWSCYAHQSARITGLLQGGIGSRWRRISRECPPEPPGPVSSTPERRKSPRPPLRTPFALRHFRSATTTARRRRRLCQRPVNQTQDPPRKWLRSLLSISCLLPSMSLRSSRKKELLWKLFTLFS